MSVLLINDFSGGLNTRFRQNRIADNESPASRNARWTRYGALSKREGTLIHQITPDANIAALSSCFSCSPTGSGERLFIADVNGRVYRSTQAAGTFTFVVDVTGGKIEFLILNQNIYMTDGSVAVRRIDTSYDVTSITDYPLAREHVLHKNRVFTLNTAANPSRLQWSAINDAETWTSTNFEDISPNDGSDGMALASFGDELVIFKAGNLQPNNYGNTSMYRLLGDSFDATNVAYSLQKIPTKYNAGVAFPRTVKLYNGALIFYTPDGFYAYEGGGRMPHPISESLRGDMINWSHGNSGTIYQAAAIVHRNKYICSVRRGAAPTEAVYVFEDGKWNMDYIGDGTDSFATGGDTGLDWCINAGNLYSASNFGSGGIGGGALGTGILRRWYPATVLQTDTLDSNTAANVNFSYLTKEFDLGREVHFTHCYIHLRRQSSGTLTFEVNTDQRGVVSTAVDISVGDIGTTESSSSNILKKRINIQRRGRTIQFRMYNSEAIEIEIYSIELHYEKGYFQDK